MLYPFRHLSNRVPWHATGLEDRVCAAPRLNGVCLKLKRLSAVVPFVEDSAGARILIGVGRVRHIGLLQAYQYSTQDLNGNLRSALEADGAAFDPARLQERLSVALPRGPGQGGRRPGL